MKNGIEHYNNKMEMRKELRIAQKLPQKICQDSFELGWQKAVRWITETKQ